jgi:hypothetical protein
MSTEVYARQETFSVSKCKPGICLGTDRWSQVTGQVSKCVSVSVESQTRVSMYQPHHSWSIEISVSTFVEVGSTYNVSSFRSLLHARCTNCTLIFVCNIEIYACSTLHIKNIKMSRSKSWTDFLRSYMQKVAQISSSSSQGVPQAKGWGWFGSTPWTSGSNSRIHTPCF